MTTAVIRGRILTRSWPTIASLFLALATFFAAISAASAQNIQLAPGVFQNITPTQRTVEIQGGGLLFLDAHEVQDRDFNVVIRSHQNNPTQLWILTDAGSGLWTIQQQSSGRFLDAHEIAELDYRVVTRPQQGNPTQLWRLVDYGGGFYTIQHVSSGRFLQPYIDEAHDFQVVTRPEGADGNLQVWRIVDR